MVTITVSKDEFIFEVKGLHKLWSLKSVLRVKREHVVQIHTNINAMDHFGMRFPGTYIPGIIKSGTYFHGSDKDFWDVVHRDKAIVIELKDEDFKRIVIEVEDVSEAIQILTTTH